MIWGVNAHLGADPYATTPASTVFKQLKSMGMTYCRIDVCTDDNGNVIQFAPEFNDYVANAPKYGIKLLVMLYIPYDLKQSWQTEYKNGYNQAYNFVKLHGKNIDVIELGNEMDNSSDLCTGGTDDGQIASDYNAANMHILAGYLTGMCDGAHKAKPGIRCAIDCINHPHWGWFQVLSNEHVPWDITAVHWYSSSGSILHTWEQNGLAQFSKFGRPIWATELNSAAGSQRGDDANISGLGSVVSDMESYPTVQAIIPYELYDEPMWKSKGDSEGFYGLYSDPSTPKPIATAITSWIKGSKPQ